MLLWNNLEYKSRMYNRLWALSLKTCVFTRHLTRLSYSCSERNEGSLAFGVYSQLKIRYIPLSHFDAVHSLLLIFFEKAIFGGVRYKMLEQPFKPQS